MGLAVIGPWVRANLTGELTQAFHLHRQDGVCGTTLKVNRLVLKKVVSCMDRQHPQTVEETIYLIVDILLLMELGLLLVVHLTFLQLSSGPLRQYKKLALMNLVTRQGAVYVFIHV